MRVRTGEDKKNIPVRVDTLIHDDKLGYGVKGVNLVNDEELTVFLTDKGKAAKDPKRPKLEDLFDGVKTKKGEVLKLKKGGIISMNMAARKRKGIYIAQWPQIIRHDENGSCALCQHGTLIPTEREDGSVAADFYSFHPEESMQFDPNSATQAIAQNAEQTTRPAYLIRAVDKTEVLDYEMHLRVYDNENECPMTPARIADSVADTASQMAENHPGKKIEILPASRFFIPASSWEKRQKYFTGLQRHFTKDLGGGDQEYFAKQAIIRRGGDNDQYCNQINVIEPFKQGDDPVLIGGYRHSAEQSDKSQAACRPNT